MIAFFLRLVLLITTIAANTSSNDSIAAFHQPIPNPKPDNIMRAWNCHGHSQRSLVDHLMQANIVKSEPVRQVMKIVDRKYYIPQNPYQDSPQGIGLGQTISAPHMHAHVLEEILPYLENSPRDNLKLLDVGCGSGYLTATFGRWVHSDDGDGKTRILSKPGQVYAMDIYNELVDLTNSNMQTADSDLLKEGTVRLKTGNGWEGWPEAAPFDAIHVGAAAKEFPADLAQQLALHGVLIVPLGPNGGVQYLYKIERVAESENYQATDFKATRLLGVRYVPLIHGPDEASART
jgi:protein-L-isoaspartate(D-aspartate) O-methyltransferase